MAKPKYKFVSPIGELPYIDRALEDGDSWRSVKKQLRHWYLQQAASLRSFTEAEYFEAEEQAELASAEETYQRQSAELDNARNSWCGYCCL